MIAAGIARRAVALAAVSGLGGCGQAEGIGSDTFGNLAYLSALLILITAGFWHRFRDRMGESLRALLIWALIFLAVATAYGFREQARDIGLTAIGVPPPGVPTIESNGEVVITRTIGGAFVVVAQVNGTDRERFALDTGASTVVLTAQSAAALGITPSESDFDTRVSTANGTTMAAPIQLASITIGPITEHDVPAMVSRPGALSTNLLGQSFLDRLPSYEVRGDRLILRSR